MKRHNSWPDAWEQLRTEYEIQGCIGVGAEFENLEKHVIVDFEFDVNSAMELINEGDYKPDFVVVRLKNGSKARYVGGEPNKLIFDFLKEQKLLNRTFD